MDFSFLASFFRTKIIGGDTGNVYAILKFFLTNIRHGIFPLWDPFFLLGHPFLISNNYFGAFSPLWTFTFILNTLGVGFYYAFLYTFAVYLLNIY